MKSYEELTQGWDVVMLNAPILDESLFRPVARVVDVFLHMDSGVVFQVDRSTREYRFTPTPSPSTEKESCRYKPFIPWPD